MRVCQFSMSNFKSHENGLLSPIGKKYWTFIDVRTDVMYVEWG